MIFAVSEASSTDEGLKVIIWKKIDSEIEQITLAINSSWYVVGSMSRYMFRATCLCYIAHVVPQHFILYNDFNCQNVRYKHVLCHGFWFYFGWVWLFHFTLKRVGFDFFFHVLLQVTQTLIRLYRIHHILFFFSQLYNLLNFF